MINPSILLQISEKIETKRRIEEILRCFKSPDVETTVGLIDVNRASVYEPYLSNDAAWLHRTLPQIERELKARAAEELETEIAKIDAWLSERIVS